MARSSGAPMTLRLAKSSQCSSPKPEARRATRNHAGCTKALVHKGTSSPKQQPVKYPPAGCTKALVHKGFSSPHQSTVLKTACLSGGSAVGRLSVKITTGVEMIAYIKELNASATAEQAKRDIANIAEQQTVRDRLTPLETRLEKLLTTIPVEVQNEGLCLNTLQVSLKGRWRGNCHPGELGNALRKLGYKRQRRWSGEDGFRALWYP